MKTVQRNKKNPLDTLFNAFMNDKITKNVSTYNGIYKRIQAYGQAQKIKPCIYINNLKRLHYSPILYGLEQYKHYTNIQYKKTYYDTDKIKVLSYKNPSKSAKSFQQFLQKKSQKFNSSRIKSYRFIHTYSELNSILIPAYR